MELRPLFVGGPFAASSLGLFWHYPRLTVKLLLVDLFDTVLMMRNFSESSLKLTNGLSVSLCFPSLVFEVRFLSL